MVGDVFNSMQKKKGDIYIYICTYFTVYLFFQTLNKSVFDVNLSNVCYRVSRRRYRVSWVVVQGRLKRGVG